MPNIHKKAHRLPLASMIIVHKKTEAPTTISRRKSGHGQDEQTSGLVVNKKTESMMVKAMRLATGSLGFSRNKIRIRKT